jgi:hypothetical protein
MPKFTPTKMMLFGFPRNKSAQPRSTFWSAIQLQLFQLLQRRLALPKVVEVNSKLYEASDAIPSIKIAIYVNCIRCWALPRKHPEESSLDIEPPHSREWVFDRE